MKDKHSDQELEVLAAIGELLVAKLVKTMKRKYEVSK